MSGPRLQAWRCTQCSTAGAGALAGAEHTRATGHTVHFHGGWIEAPSAGDAPPLASRVIPLAPHLRAPAHDDVPRFHEFAQPRRDFGPPPPPVPPTGDTPANLTMFSDAGGMVEVERHADGRLSLAVAEPLPAPRQRITLTPEQTRDFVRTCLADVLSWEMVDALDDAIEETGTSGRFRPLPALSDLLHSLLPPRGPQA